MKKFVLIFGLFSVVTHFTYGQAFAGSIGFSGGWVEDGLGFNVSYNHHFDRTSYLQFGMFGGFSTDKSTTEEIPYSIIAFQPAYFKRIITSDGSKPISLYLGIGGLVGYEIINNGKETLDSGALIDAESKLLYGGYLGAELEYVFSDNISFGLKYNQHYQPPSDIGSFYPFVGLSLRYYLY